LLAPALLALSPCLGPCSRAHETPPQLGRVEQDGAFSGLVSGGSSSSATDAAASPEAQRVASRIVHGVTVWRRQLDHVVDALYDGGAGKLESTVRDALRMGLFELLHGGTHAHAAVNEAVQALRGVRPRAAGLANAVLREAARRDEEGTLLQLLPAVVGDGDGATDGSTSSAVAAARRLVTALGVRHSMPDWLVSRWLRRLGRAEAEALLAACNRQPAYGIRAAGPASRASPAAGAAALAALAAEAACSAVGGDGGCVEASLLPGEFLRVSGTLAPLRAALAEGRAALQDEAAALVVSLLDPTPGCALADVCAAPGGKALLAAHRGALVTVVDAHAPRLQLLLAAAEAQGLGDRLVATHAADARDFAALPALQRAFDAVLVDAPCTGLGVLAKRADLRWRRAEADLPERAALQGALLAAAAALVKPGGRLVYSTCSTEPEENEDVVAAFLAASAGDFELERAADVARAADGAPAVPRLALSADGRFLAPAPHRTGTDGAFGARMRRLR